MASRRQSRQHRLNDVSYVTTSLSCLALLLVTSAGCATYRIGAQALYRPDIRTVHVPSVESETYRRNMGEWLTEALVKEIETKTTMKVAGAANADSTLRVRIVALNKSALAEDVEGIPRQTELNFVTQAEWVDRRGQILMAVNVGQSADLVSQGGQSIVSAQHEAVRKLAEQIVGRMEINW